MQISIGDILKQRLAEYEKNPQEAMRNKSKEFNKQWAFAVKCFQDKINTDRKREKRELVPFIAVREKLVALREIDDLRWFYRECIRYSNTYVKGTHTRNTFSKGFYGALDTKKLK